MLSSWIDLASSVVAFTFPYVIFDLAKRSPSHRPSAKNDKFLILNGFNQNMITMQNIEKEPGLNRNIGYKNVIRKKIIRKIGSEIFKFE